MDKIERALKDLSEALKTIETVERIKVSITLIKPKPDKAKPESK